MAVGGCPSVRMCTRRLPRMTNLVLDGGLVEVVAADGARVGADVPGPHRHGIPLLDLEARRCAMFWGVWLRGGRGREGARGSMLPAPPHPSCIHTHRPTPSPYIYIPPPNPGPQGHPFIILMADHLPAPPAVAALADAVSAAPPPAAAPAPAGRSSSILASSDILLGDCSRSFCGVWMYGVDGGG